MNKMKCPICGNDLEQYHTGLVCYRHCLNGKNVWGSEETLKELERTRKALDVAVDALKRIDETRSGVKENLHATNGRTLNAGNGFCWATIDEIHNALDEITALEQKDK